MRPWRSTPRNGNPLELLLDRPHRAAGRMGSPRQNQESSRNPVVWLNFKIKVEDENTNTIQEIDSTGSLVQSKARGDPLPAVPGTWTTGFCALLFLFVGFEIFEETRLRFRRHVICTQVQK